jgi:hypothetical protein
MRPLLIVLISAISIPPANAAVALRKVSSSSCQIIPVHLSVGMTTQIVLDQEPKATLYADKKHFKIVTNSTSPRSLAVIPVIEGSDLDPFRDARGALPSPTALATALNKNFKTNLFVFFDNNNQLMFELRFTDKNSADYILKVNEVFNGDCNL